MTPTLYTQTSPESPATQIGRLGLKAKTTDARFVLRKRSRPLLVPIQIFPSRSLRMGDTTSSLNPSFALNDSTAVLNSLISPFSSSGAGERRSPSPRLVIHR